MVMRVLGAFLVVAVVVAAAAVGSGAQQQQPGPAAHSYEPPKTPWGDPDIQGGYSNVNENGIPLERPGNLGERTIDDIEDSELADLIRERNERARAGAAAIGGRDTGAGPTHWYEHYDARNSRPWMVSDPPDGRIPPLTPQAEQRRKEILTKAREYASWEDYHALERCLATHTPNGPQAYNSGTYIMQSPGWIMIVRERLDTRIIPLDGRPPLHPSIHQWNGDARGRFEGNTLVVEWTNFTDKQEFAGAPQGNMRFTERFTKVDANTVNYEVTVTDPTTKKTTKMAYITSVQMASDRVTASRPKKRWRTPAWLPTGMTWTARAWVCSSARGRAGSRPSRKTAGRWWRRGPTGCRPSSCPCTCRTSPPP